jgi:hypothetical protein
LVSVVKQGEAPEIDCSADAATIVAMSTLDYWIYSTGLVLVTIAVIVA